MLGAPGSVLTATSTANGYDVKEIYNMLETTAWKAANTASPHYISFDGGSAPAIYTADCLAIIGHNIASAGALVGLQYSFDGFATEAVDVFPQFTPTSDKAIFKEFANPGAKRYWRLALSNMTAPVYLSVCIWGNATELDYATAGFDPHEQEVKANVSVSETGYLLGIHHKYIERSMTLKFEDADADLYAKVREWWEANGLKNFFVVWEGANSPDDVFLMRPDAKFSNPLKAGGLYRDITISLRGRKE
ncbi:MAG: hypothetical protein HZB85_01875 [Deltaproteobacteria bacterium]|nr:hypothetical protein [Deltaproteobacteria bacterium]